MSRSPKSSESFEDFATLNIELADIATGRTRERSIFPARQAAVHPIEIPRPRSYTDDRSQLARAIESTLGIVYFYTLIVISTTLAFIDALSFPGGVFSRVLKAYEYFELTVIALGTGLLVWLIASAAGSRRKERMDLERPQDGPGEASEGLNFVLRFGLVFFCMGSLILQMLRAISPLEGSASCLVFTEPLRLLRLVAYILFVILQSYFIFKYHRQKFCRHIRLVRLALLHLVVVNLSLWFRSVVLEGKEMCESHALPISNSTCLEASAAPRSTAVEPGYTACDSERLASKAAQPYLFPCMIQYALISAGVFANMYLRLEDVEEKEEEEEDEEETSRHRRKMSCVSSMTMQEISTNRNAEVVVKTSKVRSYSVRNLVVPQTNLCAKSHTGFFTSILFLILYIIFDVAQFLYHRKSNNMSPEHYKIFYSVADAIFHGCALLVVIALFVRMTGQLNYHNDRRHFIDRSLMLTAFFAQMLFSFLLINTNLRQVRVGQRMEIFSLLRHCLHLLLYCCQTVFILTGIHMRARNEHQVRSKPGKNLLTILITANLMFWFEESLLLEDHVYAEKYQIFYGQPTWCLLVSACKPLVVFYKFHSASMMAEMWVNAYNFCLLDLQQVDKVQGPEIMEEEKSE